MKDKRTVGVMILCAVGFLQIIGHAAGSRVLKGIGAATGFAPFPKVFSDVDGLETFASEFTMHVTTASGQTMTIPITPELYHRLSGPYNRRNVYGAALSYAPRLPEKLWQAVYHYAFCPGGPLRKELGLPDDTVRVDVSIRTKTKGRNDVWVLKHSCEK